MIKIFKYFLYDFVLDVQNLLGIDIPTKEINFTNDKMSFFTVTFLLLSIIMVINLSRMLYHFIKYKKNKGNVNIDDVYYYGMSAHDYNKAMKTKTLLSNNDTLSKCARLFSFNMLFTFIIVVAAFLVDAMK